MKINFVIGTENIEKKKYSTKVNNARGTHYDYEMYTMYKKPNFVKIIKCSRIK